VVDYQLPSSVHFDEYIGEQPGSIEEFAFIFQDRSAMARHGRRVPKSGWPALHCRRGGKVAASRPSLPIAKVLASSQCYRPGPHAMAVVRSRQDTTLGAAQRGAVQPVTVLYNCLDTCIWQQSFDRPVILLLGTNGKWPPQTWFVSTITKTYLGLANQCVETAVFAARAAPRAFGFNTSEIWFHSIIESENP
jgi:hypothetical protein